MRHILKGSGLPETIHSIEEAIAILETRVNEALVDLAGIYEDTDIDTDDELKAIVHYNTIIINYLETLKNN